jgi:hypothetical protein
MLGNRTTLVPGVLLLSLFTGSGMAQQKPASHELSPKAAEAIEKGLQYLIKTQNRDGSWDNKNQVGVTALSLMAFMVKGYFPEKEPYGEPLSRAVDFLLLSSRTSEKGYMGRSLYDHGLATLALSEVWGESSRSDEIRTALRQAVAVIVKSQTGLGGWRYQPDGLDQDISSTVMQLVALASAREAGILVPEETIQNATRYVKACFNPANGGFFYKSRQDPNVRGVDLRTGFARSAAGVVSLQMCSQRDAEEVRRGLDYLRALGPDVFKPRYDWFYYGHYYAIQAMYQDGEASYQNWYPMIRDALINAQQSNGSWGGGSSPPGTNTIIQIDPDSYCTPMAILILGVPHRFLPIYQR